MSISEFIQPGVYARTADSAVVLVHAYQDDSYALDDIVELFGRGRFEEEPGGLHVLTLTGREVRHLKVQADAYSFDYEPGLIELCLDMHRFAISARAGPEPFRFWSVD